MTTERVAWQDNAKGIGIALVVYGHAVRGLVAGHYLSSPIWRVADFALYTFHMPLFMFLAGLNVPRSIAKGNSRFIRSKLLGVAAPYFIWSTIQGLVMLALAGVLNTPPPHNLLASEFWQPISPFWFLYVLFVLLMAASVISERALLVLALIAFPFGEMFGKDALSHQLLHYPIFFVLGVAAADRPLTISPRAVLVGAVIAIIAIAIARLQGFQDYNSVIMLPAAIGGSVFVIWISQRFGNGLVARLGRLSMPIYVMHILATAGVRVAMSKLHVPHIGAIYVACDVAAGITLPVVAYLAFEQIGALAWLGLGVSPKGARWIEGRSSDDGHA